jgi:hypothetical protein
MPTRACSGGYKLRSIEGECPKSLDVNVSCECSKGVVVCSILCWSCSLFVMLVPASPFIVQGGLVYKG